MRLVFFGVKEGSLGVRDWPVQVSIRGSSIYEGSEVSLRISDLHGS